MASKKAVLKKVAAKKVAAPKAARTTTPSFNPAAMPVLGFKQRSIKVGRRMQHLYVTELDGEGAAAFEIAEKDVVSHRKAGRIVAYVNGSLRALSFDLEYVSKAAKAMYGDDADKAMSFYVTYVGEPMANTVEPDKFEHVHGADHRLYEGCDDQEDFDKVDAHMAHEYARILKQNAKDAKTAMRTVALYTQGVNRTPEQEIVHFAWAAHGHEKCADEMKKMAIHYSNVYKAHLGLSKIDHSDPRYKAFTAPVWNLYLAERDLAREARLIMNQAAAKLASKVADRRQAIPH
jgi:hypothetical protein